MLTTTFNDKSPLPWQPVAIFRPFIHVHSLLSIQKMSGGGRPGGGLHGRISEEPSVTRIGSRTSLGHRGASEGRHKKSYKKKKKTERPEEEQVVGKVFSLETRSRILLDRAAPNSLLAKHWYSPS